MYRLDIKTHQIKKCQVLKQDARQITFRYPRDTGGTFTVTERLKSNTHKWFETSEQATEHLRAELLKIIQFHETELSRYWELLNRLT